MDRGDRMGPVAVRSDGTSACADREFRDLVDVDGPATVTGPPLGRFVADADRERPAAHFDRPGRNENPVYGVVVALEREGDVRAAGLTNRTESGGLWPIYWSVTASGSSTDRSPNDSRESVLTVRAPVEACRSASRGVAG